jgi:hypothetical protein
MVKGLAMIEPISIDDLAHVCGGGVAYDAFVNEQRAEIAGDYRVVVCKGAGVKGGPKFATKVYGADRTTGKDMVRAAKTLRTVCFDGKRLPEGAPPHPF